MRTASLATVLSAALHAAAIAWLAVRAPISVRTTDLSTSPPVLIEIVPAVAPVSPMAPTEVVLLDERAVRSLHQRPVDSADTRAPVSRNQAPPTPASSTDRPTATAAASTAHAATAPENGRAAETAPRTQERSPLLDMRRGQAPRAVLPAGKWDDLDHAPAGTTPERDLSTGMLRDSGGGTHRSDQSVFVADVAPDGTVVITDKPNVQAHILVPTPGDLGRSLAKWNESDKGRHGKEGDTSMSRQIQVTAGPAIDAPMDPSAHSGNDQATQVIIPVLGLTFDITDAIMRSRGQDPYARRKLVFLDATRDERVQIGQRHRTAQLARSPQLVERNLAAMWAATTDLATRKRALFELWEECVEAGDAEVVAAGQAARRLVVAFIRSHLPAGSADAFTPAELAAFAQIRRSKAAFQPYE